jgi:hypothetical protein
MKTSTKQNTTHLQDRLNRLLIGRKILDAWYTDEGELAIHMNNRKDEPMLVVSVMRDAEGNGPGALHCYESKKVGREKLTVIPGSASCASE